jgi:hypothetical protein
MLGMIFVAYGAVRDMTKVSEKAERQREADDAQRKAHFDEQIALYRERKARSDQRRVDGHAEHNRRIRQPGNGLT